MSESKTYAVCQTSYCQQTYELNELAEKIGGITKDTKNIACEKCGGVLVDEHGKANLSGNAAVRPVVDMEKYEEQQKRRLREKREELKEIQEEIQELEAEGYGDAEE